MDIYKQKYFLYKKKYIELKHKISYNQEGGDKTNADLFKDAFSSQTLKVIQEQRELYYKDFSTNFYQTITSINAAFVKLLRKELFLKYYYDILTNKNKEENHILIEYLETCTEAFSDMLENKVIIVSLNMTLRRMLLGDAIQHAPYIFKIVIDKIYNKTFDEFQKMKNPILEDFQEISWKDLKLEFNKELSLEPIDDMVVIEKIINPSLLELYNNL